MTATVVVVRSSAKAVIYYERDGYYLRNDPEHRQASFWYGDAAKALGLRAHVHPSRFEAVLSGYVPGTDLRLGRMREGQHEHRPGWDITLSAPKSVSLEALVMGDRRVIRAHDEAVREAPPEELGLEAGRRWLALAPEHRADTLILAPTHAICRQANEAVREGLAEEGALRGRTLAVDRLVNRRLTRVQASDIRSYEPGDTVVFHRDVFGCRANDVCIVMGHDDGRVVLAHPDGERRFRPSGNAARYLGLYDTERIELRAGDLIRWTRNRKAPLARGSQGTGFEPDRSNPVRQLAQERNQRFRGAGDPRLRHDLALLVENAD